MIPWNGTGNDGRTEQEKERKRVIYRETREWGVKRGKSEIEWNKRERGRERGREREREREREKERVR